MQCTGYRRPNTPMHPVHGGVGVARMEAFAARRLDYALLCCDGVYNMDVEEASACAALIGAGHSIPYHMAPGELFSRERAGQFKADGRLIVPAGEEIVLEKE